MVSHHLTMFDGHWSIASWDMNYLISHLTSKNNVIKESSIFMSRSSLSHVTTLQNLVTTAIAVVKICF